MMERRGAGGDRSGRGEEPFAGDTRLHLEILPQPDETTCGPTCLHAIYGYYGDDVPLDRVIREVRHLESGGTLGVFLALHALRRGYRCRIYTFDLKVFDPTWFTVPGTDLAAKLRLQLRHKRSPKMKAATEGYLEYLGLGGEIRLEDLTTALLRRYLTRSIPLLSGLSSTYLYGSPRERGDEDDDLRGDPQGHFVVLHGYRREGRSVLVADPYRRNPMSPGQLYAVGIDRLLCSVLLGVLTYDANILAISPPRRRV